MWANFVSIPNDDETINDVFCIKGLFKISCEEEVQTYPKVKAIVQNHKMLLSIDRSLYLLENENVAECSFLSFDSEIDTLIVSRSSELIICGLSNGNVHGIFRGIHVFNLCVMDGDIGDGKTFAEINEVDDVIYLMCCNGSLYRLKNIDEKIILELSDQESIGDNETRLSDKTIMKNVALQKMPLKTAHKDVSAFSIIPQDSEICAIISAGNRIYFHSENENSSTAIPKIYGDVKNMFNLGNYLLALTTSGHLIEICPYTKLVFNHFEIDFNILIDAVTVMSNNENEIELLVLTKTNEINGSRHMKILDFPSMKCNYELEIPSTAWIVEQSKVSLNVYYLDCSEINADGIPQEIEMNVVSETDPAQRFKKLIQRGHLDQAEAFGKEFGISLQPIYEARAQRLLKQISKINYNDHEAIHYKFNGLLEILKLIESEDFFLSIHQIDIPHRKILMKYLEFLLFKLKGKKNNEILIEIKEQILRLETLMLIDPHECNLEWQKFIYHPNLIKVCTTLFKSDILTACIIWKRHVACIMPNLDEKNILKMLNAIPATAEAFVILQWLRHFVPVVLQVHPEVMHLVIDWSMEKTRSLQYNSHWPEVGLEFSTNVLTIFEDINFLYCDIRRQYESNVEKLQNLINALQDLSVLKKNYNLTLTLDNYIKDSIHEIALHILQRVQLGNLEKLVNDFLYPIFMEKGLLPNGAIMKYIEFLIGNRKTISFWMERAVVCINLLHNEDEKLKCALLVLKSSSVPWPEAANSLVKLSNSGHPLAGDIRTEYELQKIKIMKVKYGWPANSNDNYMKLVFRIVKLALPEMAEDIKTLVKISPGIAASANFYCCYELAKSGDVKGALTYLDELDEKARIECCERVANIFTSLLESTDTLDYGSNLMEFLKLINSRAHFTDKENLKCLENTQILRNEFNVKCRCDQLSSELYRRQILEDGLNFIVNTVKEKKENFVYYIWRKTSILTSALQFGKSFGILEMAKKFKNIRLSCALAFLVLDLDEVNKISYEDYIEFAIVLIGQQINTFQGGTSDFGIIDPLVYPLAYKLLVEAQKFGALKQSEIIELLKWARVGNTVYDLNSIETTYHDLKNIETEVINSLNTFEKSNSKNHSERRESISVFEQVQDAKEAVKPQSDPTPIIKCISFALQVILCDFNPADRILSRLQAIVNAAEPNQLEHTKEEFYKSLDRLIKIKQYNSWFVIVQLILTYQSELSSKILHENFVSLQMRKIFRFSLSQKDVNFIDLFAMLLSDPDPEGFLKRIFDELKHDQQKVNFLALSEMYSVHIGDVTNIPKQRESRLKYYYYMELCKKDLTLKNTNKSNMEFVSISQLMKQLKNKILDVELLRKLSADFNWDYQHVLVLQLITVLNLQEAEFEVTTDAFGTEEIIMKTSAEQIREICQPYVNEIINTTLLTSKLLSFISEINYYFYELYLCVIDILTCVNTLPKEMELWSSILLFLKHKMITKRENRPGQLETDWWLKSQPEIGVLPKIARYRFPFKPIVQEPLKSILDDEVSVENCESWFPLIKLHTTLQGFDSIIEMQDYLCMAAVKNSIAEYKQSHNGSKCDVWNLTPINNAFLQSILRLITHVHDMSKILFIFYFVMNHAPEGADQVEAAHECYKFAIKHESQLMTMEKAQPLVLKIKRKYPIFKIQHLLHVYGLMEEKLLQLVENPKELIKELYHHPCILKFQKPDINMVAAEIAELHGIEFNTIQISLLLEWLSLGSQSDAVDADETYYEDLNSTVTPMEAIGDEFVTRAHYILSSWETEKAIDFLICHIFPVNGAVETGKQLQMFECFAKLIDESNNSYVEIVSQNQYIVVKCVHYLKQLGYNFTVEKFNDYDKLSILKKIWQNHASVSHGLEVIAYICLGFNIDVPQIWNGVLKQMVNLNMVKELNSLVDLLSCKNSLLFTEGLISAWECVLRAPFKSANRTRSYDQEVLLSKNLFRIQSCPVASHLNIFEFAECCIRLDRPHMAAILLPFMTDSIKRQKTREVILKNKKNDLRKEVIELEEAGILPTITNCVLKELRL